MSHSIREPLSIVVPTVTDSYSVIDDIHVNRLKKFVKAVVAEWAYNDVYPIAYTDVAQKFADSLSSPDHQLTANPEHR